MRNKIVAKTTRVYDFYYVDHKCDLQFNIVDLLYFSFTSSYFLMVFFFYNIYRNIPHIHLHEKRDNKERWNGAEIQVVIEGNWTTYRVCSI